MRPDFLTMLTLFAEDGGEAAGGGGAGIFNMLLPFIAIGFLFYFLLIRPQKAEQAKRQSMLAAVKKNDRVITIGGIYGVVTNVQKETDEVTIKVDESTNTKLRMSLGSIARILGDEPPAEQPASSHNPS
jgi:preprotein translocase subunit YajC